LKSDQPDIHQTCGQRGGLSGDQTGTNGRDRLEDHPQHPADPDRAGKGSRPTDYRELDQQLKDGVELEYGWSQFFHAFFAVRTASFFSYPSPLMRRKYVPRKRRNDPFG
jgi:hypothetical protein